MPTFTTLNPVAINRATKVEHFDAVFDNTQALQQGTVPLEQVMLNGLASDPSVSPAGDAVLFYHTPTNSIRVSSNGSAFKRLNKSAAAMALILGG